jgi:hypothetical protein
VCSAPVLGILIAGAAAIGPGGTLFAVGHSFASRLSQLESEGPWSMQSFGPPAHASAPRNVFEGRMRFEPRGPTTHFRTLVDRYSYASTNDGARTQLPTFDFEFVQTEGAIIPVRRGTISDPAAAYDYILEPGRAWDEPGDKGFSRAALPFALEERNENCIHNGVLTFLFRSDGRISKVAYEIASETCAYFQFDAWGTSGARYLPEHVAKRAQIVADYRREVAHRLPTRPIAALAEHHPAIDPSRFASAREVRPQDLTTYGIVADGIHYAGSCPTRLGSYPFCDVLDLPSYSLAKSLAAGLALMRAALFFPRIASVRIADEVPQCASAGGWNDVTLGDTINMLTGHFRSSAYMQDEYAADVAPFFDATDHLAKITFACTHYPRKAPPGEVWVYHTSDTYLLGTALQTFYRERRGMGVDAFQELLVEPIWKPLHLSPTIGVTRRTADSARQPFMGYGLTLQADDLAKLLIFINVDHGSIDGRFVINREMLDDALRRSSRTPAYTDASRELSYANGFWAWNAQRTFNCHQPVWVPLMLGYGGIVVALLPTGTAYYYFSDGGSFKWQVAAAEAFKIHPSCTPLH